MWVVQFYWMFRDSCLHFLKVYSLHYVFWCRWFDILYVYSIEKNDQYAHILQFHPAKVPKISHSKFLKSQKYVN